MEQVIATLGVFFFLSFFIIGIFAVVGFFAIIIRTGNMVKELRKLNEEFNKYTEWCYKNILMAIKEK